MNFFSGSLPATSTCSSIRYTSRSDSFLPFSLFYTALLRSFPRCVRVKKRGFAYLAVALDTNYVPYRKSVVLALKEIEQEIRRFLIKVIKARLRSLTVVVCETQIT